MKTRIAVVATSVCTALLLASAPAVASQAQIEHVARESGLSERKVRMVLGNRTPYAEYRFTYARSAARIKQAIGEKQFERLMVGLPLQLPHDPVAVDAAGDVRAVL
ncbi:hypothetical protein [Lysobacter sp. A3-1-A15]|uniref:hypothetical protein n=1 Tax=Novilysobacter viscosus TaxID=3098602 RepID=UPI002EDB3014